MQSIVPLSRLELSQGRDSHLDDLVHHVRLALGLLQLASGNPDRRFRRDGFSCLSASSRHVVVLCHAHFHAVKAMMSERIKTIPYLRTVANK